MHLPTILDFNILCKKIKDELQDSYLNQNMQPFLKYSPFEM